MHVSHLSPETLSMQAHTPLVTSQVSSADPTSLQAHAMKGIKIDYCNIFLLIFTIFIDLSTFTCRETKETRGTLITFIICYIVSTITYSSIIITGDIMGTIFIAFTS